MLLFLRPVCVTSTISHNRDGQSVSLFASEVRSHTITEKQIDRCEDRKALGFGVSHSLRKIILDPVSMLQLSTIFTRVFFFT